MTINPLSIPASAAPQTLDFSPLAQLPQVYRQAQGDAWTLANLDRVRDVRELTPAIKEYNLAKSQGFDGTFLEYLTRRRMT
jgi:hypothetical protein